MQRMKKRREFLSTAASGHKWVRPAFVVQCAANDGCGQPPQVGFTATKKLGGAVLRNRIKRRLREAVRKFLPEKLQPGYNYVVIGRPDAAHLDFSTLGAELAEAVEKLHRVMAQRNSHK